MCSENRVSALAWAKRSLLKSIGWIALGFLAAPAPSQAVVLSGYDLFTTSPTTYFGPLGFTGVALNSNTFDFCGSIGVQGVGSTDTIVHRLDDVTTDSGTTRLQILALQLVSSNTVDLGSGPESIYVTLNSTGPQTNNSMTILGANTGMGTFSSSLDFFIDFRIGGVNGTIVNTTICSALGVVCAGPGDSLEVILGSTGVAWSSAAPILDGVQVNCPPGLQHCHQVELTPDPNAPLSPLVLAGVNDSGFFPTGPNGNGSFIEFVPEIDAASGTGALSLLAGGLALVGERRRRKAA